MSKPKKLKIAELDLLWWGASCGGEHYHAKLSFERNGKEECIQLTHNMSQKMATYLNKKDGVGKYPYKKGEETIRFETEEQAVKKAIKVCEKEFPECELILKNSCGSVSQAYSGDKKIVKRINELYAEAEEIGWYSHPRFPDLEQDARMEAIDDEFDRLIREK